MNPGQFFSVLWAVSLVLLIVGSVLNQSQDLVWFKGAVKGFNVLFGSLLVISTLACVWISSGLDLTVSS